MRKSAYISDLAFAFCAASLPALCFLRFKRIPLAWAIALALLFGAGITLIVATGMRKRYSARTMKAKDKRETEKLSLHLAMLSHSEQTAFFAERAETILGEPIFNTSVLNTSALNTSADTTCQKENPLPCDKKNSFDSPSFLETETMVGYCRFRAAPLTADDVLPILTLATEKRPVLLCNALTDESKSLLLRFGIHFVPVEEIFMKLKSAEELPEVYRSEPAFAKRKTRIFSGFTKKNARPFFTGGTLILISSLFSPFPYYYLVFGCALVIVAATLRVIARD